VHKAICLSTLALLSASPVLAQSNMDNLRAAFEAAPDFLVTNPDPFHFVFFDRAAWAEATEGLGVQQTFMRLNFGEMIGPVSALRNGGIEAWEESAEIALDQVNWFAGFGPTQYAISYWGFGSEAALPPLLDRLQQGDFEYVGESDILGNGEPQAINMEKHNPSNPWRGGIGQASFIQPQGNVLLQSTYVPEAIEQLRPVDAPLADHMIVATALSGLEAGMPDDASIIQALLLSPAFGLQAVDPMAVISSTGSIDETKANLEAAMATAGQGIPAYFGGVLADIEVDGKTGLAISLSYSDCDVAADAATQIIARWDSMLGDDLPVSATHEAVPGKDGLCAASVIFTAASDDIDLAGQVYQRILMRDFPVLQIGTTL